MRQVKRKRITYICLVHLTDALRTNFRVATSAVGLPPGYKKTSKSIVTGIDIIDTSMDMGTGTDMSTGRKGHTIGAEEGHISLR